MDSKKIKIGAAMMAKNAEFFIRSSISSLSWVDGIYLYDDNSIDKTIDLAKNSARVRLFIDANKDIKPIFERGEKDARNKIIKKAFSVLKCDVLILIDSDELLSSNLKTVILDTFSDQKIDSLCFSIWHLYDLNKYIHFWETHMNGIYMIDPHIRIIRKNKLFEGGFSDGSHPFIKNTDFTKCIHGPYHYHLKYFYKSPYPNYALNFLPKYPSINDVMPYLRKLSFPLPNDVIENINNIDWGSVEHIETDYYKNYKNKRIHLMPDQARIHPRELI